jgi:hypothetical protein
VWPLGKAFRSSDQTRAPEHWSIVRAITLSLLSKLLCRPQYRTAYFVVVVPLVPWQMPSGSAKMLYQHFLFPPQLCHSPGLSQRCGIPSFEAPSVGIYFSLSLLLHSSAQPLR